MPPTRRVHSSSSKRKRNEVPETDRGETSRFRVRVRFQTGKLFERSRPSLASERNRLRVAFSRGIERNY